MKKKLGFTLIELLAVVLMIGILTSVALPQYRKSIQRSEAMESLINLKTIFESARRYRSANSEAPTKLNGLDVAFFDADTPNASSFNIGKYRYTFMSEGIRSCRLNGAGQASDTYCFTMYYVYKNNKNVLICSANVKKYKWLCEALGDQKVSDMTYIMN